MSFIDRLRARAAAVPRRLAFPEGGDARVQEAIRGLVAERLAQPVVVVAPGDVAARAAAEALGVPWVDPGSDPRREAVIERLIARRRPKPISREHAEAAAADPLVFADALVAIGELDGCVAGAVRTSADVLRAALWAVGPAPGVQTVSSAFYMVVPPFRGGSEEVLTFADCAVVATPTPAQLADIAFAAATDRRRIVGDEPRVAFLSYSTLGSAEGPAVERVRAAVSLLRARCVDFPVDGELQGDAALIPAVAERKAAGSSVAGRANVLIFPSLDAGNIAYKLVERIAHAAAIGPIVQGLARPCNDLSRGAVADDIINVAAITALQATDGTSTDLGGFRPETDQ